MLTRKMDITSCGADNHAGIVGGRIVGKRAACAAMMAVLLFAAGCASGAKKNVADSDARADAKTAVTNKMIKANGINLSVKESGAGQAMILIHGKNYSKENMDRLFNYYKDRYHVVSYDVRGHGESDKPAAFTLEDDANDLAALVESMSLKTPIVIGFSMGSYIALRTAEEHPQLFSRLVLIGTKGGGMSSTQQAEQDAAAAGMSGEEIARQMTRMVFAPQVDMEEIRAFNKEIASAVTLTAQQQAAITESLADFDLLSDAGKVAIPALVLTGEYDGLNPPAEGKKVADALPNARFEIIPNAGHIAFFENPDKVFSLIDEFLR